MGVNVSSFLTTTLSWISLFY